MSGFLNVDKPQGKSSAYVVNVVKRISQTPCGHLGTLDPFATGVLPVGVGNATRLFDYFLSKEKTYRARFCFGMTTDTLDCDGERTYGGRIPTAEEIAFALPALTGEISQIPPAYSAKSVGGRRAYRLAREGTSFELPAKKVFVRSFRLCGQISEEEFEFEIVCGAGTYIRALARDLASSLGALGCCTALRRTACGVFCEENAHPLEELSPETWQDLLIPVDSVLPFPALDVEDPRLYNGLSVPTGREDGIYKLYRGGEFYGLARATGGVLKTEKKLC